MYAYTPAYTPALSVWQMPCLRHDRRGRHQCQILLNMPPSQQCFFPMIYMHEVHYVLYTLYLHIIVAEVEASRRGTPVSVLPTLSSQ